MLDTKRPLSIDETGKTSFENIYTEPDPRQYFHRLCKHNYMIAECAAPVFRECYAHIREARRLRRLQVTDVGCSYGINAALHKFPLSVSRLHAHYTARLIGGLDTQSLLAEDQAWYRALPLVDDLVFTGLDSSQPAIGYARAAGLLDFGLACNLETDKGGLPPEHDEARVFAHSDIVISTGAVGYVGAPTFTRIAEAAAGKQPWMALFVLRQFRMDDISAAMRGFGYVTEKLEGFAFPQRQFTDDTERSGALDRLRQVGRKPLPMEESGWFAAEFFLLRPEAESKKTPLNGLLGPSALSCAVRV